ncbi:MAG: DUF3105 domain-containing protein [Caldilinea sp. CFX5]|nr:DUF3105 domain-containing protein [Caldilinea sp. CFX5]
MSKLYKSTTIPLVTLLVVVLFGTMACGSSESASPTATPAPAATSTPTTVPTATAVPSVPTATAVVSTTTAPAANDILSVVGRAKGLENFVTLLASAGLTEQFQNSQPKTVFIVPNAVWDELPAAVRDNTELVNRILRNHIVEGRHLMRDMVVSGTMTSSLGISLTVLVGAEGATVQGANVLDADYEADNGILHLLDTVLLPQDVITDVMALYPSVVGEQTFAMQGNIHIAHGQFSPAPYNSTPPTSGPHYPDIVAWQLYEQPFPYEQLVHNLEDGGVVIYYQCAEPCPELVEQLRTLVQPYQETGRHVVVAPNDPTWTLSGAVKPHADMGAPIAVVAWRKLLKLDAVDAEKINQFIEAFEGIDHHVR